MFGTKQIKVDADHYMDRWRSATQATPIIPFDIPEGATTEKLLNLVNRKVNEMIIYTPDPEDNWQDSISSLTSGKGDCEDYAIAKFSLLKEIGIAPEQMTLVIGRDLLSRGKHHAVLVVENEGCNLVLDNVTDLVATDQEFVNADVFSPVVSVCDEGVFIHGKVLNGY